MPGIRKPPASAGRRNPIAKALPRLGHRVKPNAKTYTRKGRSASRDRPLAYVDAPELMCHKPQFSPGPGRKSIWVRPKNPPRVNRPLSTIAELCIPDSEASICLPRVFVSCGW